MKQVNEPRNNYKGAKDGDGYRLIDPITARGNLIAAIVSPCKANYDNGGGCKNPLPTPTALNRYHQMADSWAKSR